ncbi:MAG TPA: TetR/AcrR family transcriptional regulator [Candidatus Dormibacteraeota bacterium]
MTATAEVSQPLDSRHRILEAATRLMSERGYAGTSISMITKLSGLPASSTYWHFGSKEQLLSEVLENAASNFLHTLPRLEDVEGTPRARFHKIVSEGFGRTRSQDGPDFLRLLFMIALERGEGRNEVINTIRKVRRQVAKGWKRAFVEIYGESSDPEIAEFVERLAVFGIAASDGSFIASQIEVDHDAHQLGDMAATAFLAIADEFFSAKKSARKRAAASAKPVRAAANRNKSQ